MIDQIQSFISRKEFSKAIEALRLQSKAKPYNRRIRLRLSDVYVMAGRKGEAVSVLLTLVDQFATDGFVAKAIAMLKRIEKIEPGRRDVEKRLAKLIQDKSQRSQKAPAPDRRARPSSPVAFGFEEIDPSVDIQLGNFTAASAPEPAPSAEGTAVSQALDLDLVEEEEDAPPKEDLSTPLFDGLTPDELVAVMRGLDLVCFDAGDLILVEGEVGDSMLILSSGRVKVYVKTAGGRSTKVKEFEEGDFFGEISVLTGKPRTATLTAAEDCECLVLDRATLEEITKLHPRVKEILKEFQEKRARSTVNTIMANRG